MELKSIVRRPADYVGMLCEFHLTFYHHVEHFPTIVPSAVKELRKRLMEEELRETVEAMEAGDLVKIADGLADLLYVTFGTALSYGIPIEDVFALVHRANMAKLGPDGKPITDAGGKSIKPEGWEPPDEKIRELLALYQKMGS